MGYSKNSAKWEVYSNAILHQETRETSNKQPHSSVGKESACKAGDLA